MKNLFTILIFTLFASCSSINYTMQSNPQLRGIACINCVNETNQTQVFDLQDTILTVKANTSVFFTLPAGRKDVKVGTESLTYMPFIKGLNTLRYYIEL